MKALHTGWLKEFGMLYVGFAAPIRLVVDTLSLCMHVLNELFLCLESLGA